MFIIQMAMIKMGEILFRVLSIKWFTLIEDFHTYQRKANERLDTPLRNKIIILFLLSN